MLQESYFDFVNGLYDNMKVQTVVDQAAINEDSSLIPLLRKHGFKESFVEGIMQVNNCEFKWKDKENRGHYRYGNAKILSIERICQDWELNEEEDPDRDELNYFHFVDDVTEEWGVGIFSGEYACDSLYIYQSGSLRYLGLNMEGYIKMLIAARGCYYWQKSLVHYKNKESGLLNNDVFKEVLPHLFPEVNLDDFYKLYDSLYFEEEMVPHAK